MAQLVGQNSGSHALKVKPWSDLTLLWRRGSREYLIPLYSLENNHREPDEEERGRGRYKSYPLFNKRCNLLEGTRTTFLEGEEQALFVAMVKNARGGGGGRMPELPVKALFLGDFLMCARSFSKRKAKKKVIVQAIEQFAPWVLPNIKPVMLVRLVSLPLASSSESVHASSPFSQEVGALCLLLPISEPSRVRWSSLLAHWTPLDARIPKVCSQYPNTAAFGRYALAKGACAAIPIRSMIASHFLVLCACFLGKRGQGRGRRKGGGGSEG